MASLKTNPDIERLWHEGKTFTEIANALPPLTRNAVAGYCFRRGLKRRDANASPIRRPAPPSDAKPL